MDTNDTHPSENDYPPADQTIRVWCCQTKVTGPHVPGCTYQPDDGSILPENAAHYELFLRDLRHLLNAHGWDNTLNIADNLLAEWVLGELQGLKWVTHSANLTPGPRDIPFAKRYSKIGRTGKTLPQLEQEWAGNWTQEMMEPAPGVADARVMKHDTSVFGVRIGPCKCGDVQLGVGQNVKLVAGTRHHRVMPCYSDTENQKMVEESPQKFIGQCSCTKFNLKTFDEVLEIDNINHSILSCSPVDRGPTLDELLED